MIDTRSQEYRKNLLHRLSPLRVGFLWGFLILAYVVGLALEGRVGIEWAYAGYFFGIPVLLLAVTVWLNSHWRLRTDACGIHRRRFLFWKSWPWELFQSPTVRRGEIYASFECLSLSLFERCLIFDGHSPSDQDEVLKTCMDHMAPQESLELPETLEVETNFRQPILYTLTPHGMRIQKRKKTKNYTWKEFERIVIIRQGHLTDSFDSLRFYLPRKEFLLFNEQCEKRYWKGPSRKKFVAYLTQHVPPSKLVVCALQGPVRTLDEVHERQQRLRKETYRRILVNVFVFVSLSCLLVYIVLSDEPLILPTLMVCTVLVCVASFNLLLSIFHPAKERVFLHSEEQRHLNAPHEAASHGTDGTRTTYG